MPRSYTDLSTLILNKLADTAQTEYPASTINYQIEECLKEFSDYIPHLIPVTFKLETRTGNDLTGTASSLTDAVKSQFVAADATDEKVIHNLTDNTWAVVLTYTSASVLVLSGDIMDANESYEVYNKRCTNKKQIYIGDYFEYPLIHSVEYPLGTRRNFKVLGDILEIDIDTVPDSNSALTNLPNVDVLVRFIRPHIVSQLTDWAGVVTGTAAIAAATSVAMSSLQSSGTIEEGEEITIENHKAVYVVIADTTIASNTATVSIYPPLEAAASSTWVTTFRKSSLTGQQEEVFAELAAARLSINKASEFVNKVSLGSNVENGYLTWGEKRLGETLSKLRRMTPPVTKRRFPTD